MFRLAFLRKLLNSLLLAFSQPIAYKVLLVLSAILLLVFADSAIPFINDTIQLKINLLGLFLEPLLQSIFDIPIRQAQVLASWIYLLICVFIAWYAFKKIYKLLFDAVFILRQSWLEKNQWQKVGMSVLILLLFAALAKIILLFV